jgi:uncharacterized membrane protein YeaQ/YmgE (transglycosylase-associated protein family)
MAIAAERPRRAGARGGHARWPMKGDPDMTIFVVWFFVGAAIGGVACALMRGDEDSGVFVNVVIGVAAALAAAWYAAPRLGLAAPASGLVNFGALAVALLGAIAALAIVTGIRQRRAK